MWVYVNSHQHDSRWHHGSLSWFDPQQICVCTLKFAKVDCPKLANANDQVQKFLSPMAMPPVQTSQLVSGNTRLDPWHFHYLSRTLQSNAPTRTTPLTSSQALKIFTSAALTGILKDIVASPSNGSSSTRTLARSQCLGSMSNKPFNNSNILSPVAPNTLPMPGKSPITVTKHNMLHPKILLPHSIHWTPNKSKKYWALYVSMYKLLTLQCASHLPLSPHNKVKVAEQPWSLYPPAPQLCCHQSWCNCSICSQPHVPHLSSDASHLSP